MSTNIIKINRGDSFSTQIFVSKDLVNSYLLTDNEAVYFALMLPHQPFEEAILVKGFTKEDQDDNGEIELKLLPKETRILIPGVYYYTVKLQRGGTLDIIDDFDDPEEVYTIINRTKFIVNE